jgi:uncharacterized protein YggL (DUF469 family)
VKLKPGQKARGQWRPELGFAVWARCDPALDVRARKRLAERFLSEAIEGNRLVCGGGVFGPGARDTELRVVVVSEGHYESCTKRDRGRVQRWLRSQREVVEHRVGALVSTDHDYSMLEQRRVPRARGANEAERALRLRLQAIAAYREAVEVLGTSEVRDALSKLERAAGLAEASVDAVAKPLCRKLGLSERKQTAHHRLWGLRNFLDSYMTAARSGRRRRPGFFGPRTKLEGALFDVVDLQRQELGVISIPDMHEVERKLVWGSRVAIDEIEKLLDAPARSATGSQLARAVRIRRERARQEAVQWSKKPGWPQKRTVIFAAQSSVRATAVLGETGVDRTIIPARLAKACGAELLAIDVPVFLEKRNRKGYTDWDRSTWIGAQPALLWVSVPNTPWKAPVLAAVVPTARCPVPQVGTDWLDDAVFRRHERKDEHE